MRLTIICLTCLMFIGCGTGWCIKIDGKYQDKTGAIEYCYDPAKGVFKSESDKAVLVTEDELKKIKAESEQVQAKNESKDKLIDVLLRRFK